MGELEKHYFAYNYFFLISGSKRKDDTFVFCLINNELLIWTVEGAKICSCKKVQQRLKVALNSAKKYIPWNIKMIIY